MTNLTVSADFRAKQSVKLPPSSHPRINQDAFLRRMERLNTKRQPAARSGAIKSAPQHLDAKLMKAGAALETAWSYEIAALMVMKRLNTPEAASIAEAARAASAVVAKRIEMTSAMTLDGLQVKARAGLWRRHGEPLGDPQETDD
jgi:hypothetical protein